MASTAPTAASVRVAPARRLTWAGLLPALPGSGLQLQRLLGSCRLLLQALQGPNVQALVCNVTSSIGSSQWAGPGGQLARLHVGAATSPRQAPPPPGVCAPCVHPTPLLHPACPLPPPTPAPCPAQPPTAAAGRPPLRRDHEIRRLPLLLIQLGLGLGLPPCQLIHRFQPPQLAAAGPGPGLGLGQGLAGQNGAVGCKVKGVAAAGAAQAQMLRRGLAAGGDGAGGSVADRQLQGRGRGDCVAVALPPRCSRIALLLMHELGLPSCAQHKLSTPTPRPMPHITASMTAAPARSAARRCHR